MDNLFRLGGGTLAGGLLARKTGPKSEDDKLVRRFKCTNCGVCCSGEFGYKRKISKDEYGIFYTLDPQSQILALWSWEAQRFERLGNAMSVGPVLKPSSFIVDKKERRAIILMWCLESKNCPFHIKDKCSVWRDRPFTCKEFPLYGHRTGIGISFQCPDLVRPPMGDDMEENGRALLKAYPNEFVYLYKDMEIYRMVFDLLRDLEKNDIIRWDKDISPEKASLLIDDKRTRIDMLELLLENGIMAKAQLEKLIEELDSVEDIKGYVHPKIRKDIIGI